MQMKEIVELDVERQAIQDRIALRARQRHGYPMTKAQLRLLGDHDVTDDAVRYIEIENKQWELLGLRDSGMHEQPPL